MCYITNYCIEVSLNALPPKQNFMKIYQAVQKLLMEDTQTHRQTDLLFDKPIFIFGK
jgi:hypothetical protein